jgi:hypothetical protein
MLDVKLCTMRVSGCSCCLHLTSVCASLACPLCRSSSDGVVSASYPGPEHLGCEQSALEQMMQDQYGNYVVQKTLEVSCSCHCLLFNALLLCRGALGYSCKFSQHMLCVGSRGFVL